MAGKLPKNDTHLRHRFRRLPDPTTPEVASGWRAGVATSTLVMSVSSLTCSLTAAGIRPPALTAQRTAVITTPRLGQTLQRWTLYWLRPPRQSVHVEEVCHEERVPSLSISAEGR